MSETQKAPYNRKLGLLMLAAVGVVTVIGALLLALFGEDDPKAEKEKQRQQQVEKLPAGNPKEAERLLAEMEAQSAAAKKRRDQELGGLERAGTQRTAPPLDGPLAATIDENLLRDLDEAQREAGARPVYTDAPELPPIEEAESAPPASRAEAPRIAAYEEGMEAPETDEGADDAEDAPQTLKPQTLPRRVVQRGVPIRATLLSRIDTRVAGPIVAVVTRDVRDTLTSGPVLIPKGSRLIGTYETDVQPGVDRVPVRFTRLMLPDGRALDIGDMPAATSDGALGVNGRYRSNFLRAVGPSFIVAALGQWVDRQVAPRQVTGEGTPYGTVQSPTVVQQVMPQVNQAVLQRYAAARPYFLAQPGQEIRIIVTQDIEIPEGGA